MATSQKQKRATKRQARLRKKNKRAKNISKQKDFAPVQSITLVEKSPFSSQPPLKLPDFVNRSISFESSESYFEPRFRNISIGDNLLNRTLRRTVERRKTFWHILWDRILYGKDIVLWCLKLAEKPDLVDPFIYRYYYDSGTSRELDNFVRYERSYHNSHPASQSDRSMLSR